MYSIAAHGDAAIKPLLLFVRTSANDAGRDGVAYCLHLIGIGSRIAGRTYEEFADKEARQALLSLLSYPQLNSLVVRLLLRDPWQSDVPYVVAALRQSSIEAWALVNALKFYDLPGLPIQQALPAGTGEIAVKYPRVIEHTFAEDMAARARHELDSYDAQVSGILQAIDDRQLAAVQVEDSLLQARQFWGEWRTEFGCKNCIGVGGKQLLISTFLKNMVESHVQYYVEDDLLTICTSATARRRLLKWWDAQPPVYKAQFTQDKAAAASRTHRRIGF